jgi:predicted TIM-barrel fold metal-dependent hydrolase
MTITTEEAERLAMLNDWTVDDDDVAKGLRLVAAATSKALRSLAAERDALRADLDAQFERAKLSGVLHNQHVTKLEIENARLREALNRIDDKDSYSHGSYGPFAEIARAAKGETQ